MTTLFTVDFENNKLYDPGTKGFDFVTCRGGTIEVSTGSKHAGTYGCSVTPLTNYVCGGAKRVNTLTRLRQRFYLHPNGITIPTTRSIVIARNYHDDLSRRIYWMSLRYTDGIGYQIYMSVADNYSDSSWGSSDYTLDNQTDWNYIESDWYSAASDAGFYKLWINGSLKWNRPLTNDLNRIYYPALGAFSQAYTISGSFYIDDWVANDTGDTIGA